jgi:predicted secreted protein
MKIYVDDEEDNSVGGATIRVVSADSTISPEVLTTSDDGSATVQFNAQKSPRISLQILASAEGYTEDSKAIDLEVAKAVEETKTELPDWIIMVQ